MESNQESVFDNAMKRYQSGIPPSELISDFESLTEQSPNNSAAWTCLAWLQLLCEKNDEALRSARMSVKINRQDPQARINLSLALLETKSKGVREHIDFVKRIEVLLPDIEKELQTSIEDGLNRRPQWQSLIKIKEWLEL